MVVTPHPLAAALIERLHACPSVRVLDFACGSGRNTSALRAAGFTVVAVDDAAAAATEPLREISQAFDAAISTHGLLHGANEAIASNVRAIAECLRTGGLFYATFGSSRDARFGQGRRIGSWTFAPLDGDERDVPHTYFDRNRLAAMLAPYFQIESLEEVGVDEIAGRWAHSAKPLRGAAHWFAIGRRQ
ncbi:MAG TPA: methyltransferase domain-containing protein [Candidatus Cybelea sp.]|nr:methyltransferase domain-containing protein [Candidatus Cybelea sp.]